MNDPVAEALRAAARMLQSNGDIWDDDYARLIAAEAVAAFHRAYKGAWERGMPAYLLPDDGADLAAAVERAASLGKPAQV